MRLRFCLLICFAWLNYISMTQIGYQMLPLINAARRKVGANSVCLSSKLMASAQKQAQYQASINQMTHDGPTPLMTRFTEQGFQPLSVAENAAQTPNDSVTGVEQALEGDPPHLANIDGSSYTHFGVGVAQGSDGKYYWTQHFAQAASPSNEPCINILAPATPQANVVISNPAPPPLILPGSTPAPQIVCMNGQCFQTFQPGYYANVINTGPQPIIAY